MRSPLAVALAGAALILLACMWALVFAVPVHAAECAGQVVTASYYGTESGGRTANGERFTGRDMTAAHRTLPFGTKLRVTYRGKSVVVRVNDRGGFHKYGRSLDLSRAAASKLGMIEAGVDRVCVERL